MRRFLTTLILGNLVVAGLLSLATAINLRASRTLELERASATAANLAKSLSVEVATELRLVDNALVTLAQRLGEDPRTPDHDPAHLMDALEAQRKLLPFAAGLRFANAQGVVYTYEGPGAVVHIADRDYFSRALSTDGAVMSEPIVSRVTGGWMTGLARRVQARDGRILGVVYATISARHFEEQFSKLALGPGGVVALRSADGALAARFSVEEPDSVRGYGTTNMSEHLKAVMASPAEAASFTSTAALDGIERINAMRRVPGYPLVVITGLGMQQYLDAWRQDALRDWTFTAVVISLIAAGTVYVYRQQRRERTAVQMASALTEKQRVMLESERALKREVESLAGQFRDIYDHAPCAYYSLDGAGKFIQMNAVMAQWLGCTTEELVGRLGPPDFFTPDSVALFKRSFPRFKAEGVVGPLEFDLVGAGGRVRRVSVRATAAFSPDGEFMYSRSVMFDVSELEEARKQLALLAAEQQVMLDNDLIGILKVQERRITWSNKASERMFGYSHAEMVGLEVSALYPDPAAYERFGAVAYEALQRDGTYRGQLELRKRDGATIWVDVSGARLSEAQGDFLWMSLDITALHDQQERIEHEAYHDALTGLPNRTLLMDRLGHEIELCRRQSGSLAVCFIDLDGFKQVNDRHGHAAGDELLKGVAARILGQVRAHDTVARVGGDEFVVALPNLHDQAEAGEVIERIRASITAPMKLSTGAAVHVGASMGLASWPRHGDSPEQLLAHADRVMYEEKQARMDPGRRRV